MNITIHNTSLLVLANSLFEKVCLSLERNKFHPVERILCVENLILAQGNQQSIGDKLNVVGHEATVHADEVDGEGFADKLLFNGDCFGDDASKTLSRQLVVQ